jgi:hypothetical protein
LPSTNCRSSRPCIRLPAGASTAAWHAAANDRTITVYTYVAKARRELGLPGTDTIGVLLVDRWGRIFAREHGGFDDERATRLTAASERSDDDT